jgi:indolepyruvate ferredoxin oxidoreductase
MTGAGAASVDDAAARRCRRRTQYGGFVSGYRGLARRLDQALWSAEKFLSRAHIKFQPGLNETCGDRPGAASRSTCTGAKFDGAVSWYGRVRASIAAATYSHAISPERRSRAPVLAGDDHAAKSSTCRISRTIIFRGDYPRAVSVVSAGDHRPGLHGWAMSRYSGCWVGFKCVSDTVRARRRS